MEYLIRYVRGFSGEVFDLYWSRIGDDELRAVCNEMKHITTLKNLNLSGNLIKDVTPLVKVLQRNSSLEILYLGSNQITRITPLQKVLRSSSSLKVLYLNNNQISDLSSICEVLRHNSSLEVLRLDNNQISDATPFCEALRNNSSLVTLWFGGNQLSGSNNLEIIGDMLSTNRYNSRKRSMTLFEMMLESGILRWSVVI